MVAPVNLVGKQVQQISSKADDLTIRESMKVLPNFLQPMLTLLTGQPLLDEKGWESRPSDRLLLTLLILAIGIFTSSLAVINTKFWLLLLIPGWICTVSGLRSLEVVHLHQCSHHNWSGNKLIDRWLGTAISVIVVSRSFDTYRLEHRLHHQVNKLLTLEDVPTEFLIQKIGLQPGKSKQELWQRLLLSLISPKIHLQSFKQRLSVCFNSPSQLHNAIALSFWATLLLAVSISQTWTIFSVAYIFPLAVIYQISTTLRLAVEHKFPTLDVLSQRDKQFICDSTFAIFLGEKTPATDLPLISKIAQWFQWWMRMLFVHLLVRIFILQGDTIVHDYHHRHPGKDDWANAILARQEDINNGCPQYPKGYTRVYGFVRAIDTVLESISNLPPLEEL
jgi:fatty acid desaturase